MGHLAEANPKVMRYLDSAVTGTRANLFWLLRWVRNGCALHSVEGDQQRKERGRDGKCKNLPGWAKTGMSRPTVGCSTRRKGFQPANGKNTTNNCLINYWVHQNSQTTCHRFLVPPARIGKTKQQWLLGPAWTMTRSGLSLATTHGDNLDAVDAEPSEPSSSVGPTARLSFESLLGPAFGTAIIPSKGSPEVARKTPPPSRHKKNLA